MNTYITLFLVGFFSSMTVLSLHQAYGIYEDQIIACNFDNECIDIDIDDFMSSEKSDLLWSLYNNDIDTYSMEDLE